MFDPISSKRTDSPAGIHMLYWFKLARLDIYHVGNNKDIETDQLPQPYYKKVKIRCDLCVIEMGVVMYLP